MGWFFDPAQGAWVWSFVVTRLAIKLKYRNTPQIHADKYYINCNPCLSIFFRFNVKVFLCTYKWSRTFIDIKNTSNKFDVSFFIKNTYSGCVTKLTNKLILEYPAFLMKHQPNYNDFPTPPPRTFCNSLLFSYLYNFPLEPISR